MVATEFDLAKVDSANFIPSLSQSSYVLLESSADDPKSRSAGVTIDMLRGIGGLIFSFWMLPKDFVDVLFRSLLEEPRGPEMMSLLFDVGKVDLVELKNFRNRGRKVGSEAAMIPRASSIHDHAARATVFL
jgi:hypothetical protein